MKRIFLLLSIILIPAVQLTWGQIPPTISYQGILTDTDGAAVPDSAYSLTFNLYNAANGGSCLWSETQAVPVEQGIFNVVLGTVRPLNLSSVVMAAMRIATREPIPPTMKPATSPASTPTATRRPTSRRLSARPRGKRWREGVVTLSVTRPPSARREVVPTSTDAL